MASVTPITWAAFDTAIGECALVWGSAGIVGAQLPEADCAALRRRVQRRYAGAVAGQPDAAIAGVISAIQALLRGFSLALLIGCISGTYSTVYVATGMLVWLERVWRPQHGAGAQSAAR